MIAAVSDRRVFLILLVLDPARPRRRPGRRLRRHGRPKRLRHQGRRPVHADHDRRGRVLDHAVRRLRSSCSTTGVAAIRSAPAAADRSDSAGRGDQRDGAPATAPAAGKAATRQPAGEVRDTGRDEPAADAAAAGRKPQPRRRRRPADAAPATDRQTSSAFAVDVASPGGPAATRFRGDRSLAAEHDRLWRGAPQGRRAGRRGRSAHDQQPLLQARRSAAARATRRSSRRSRASSASTSSAARCR